MMGLEDAEMVVSLPWLGGDEDSWEVCLGVALEYHLFCRSPTSDSLFSIMNFLHVRRCCARCSDVMWYSG